MSNTEAVYMAALKLAVLVADRGSIADGLITLERLRTEREDIREALLWEFESVSGPDIADAMDEALNTVWGPLASEL